MRRSQDGWVAAWFVVTAPLLLVFLGLVLDGGVLLLRSQMLDAASDAAALAATDAWDRDYWKWHGQVRIDATRAESLARQYLSQNLPDARIVQVTVSPSNRVHVRTKLTVPFFFMRIAGWTDHTAESYSTAVRRNN
ncbi:MAG TPA: TadE/TadG family type IV pilus assembly protein [Symbiobacteriaceae bacterium]|nr:TadE/TadG family type IV pilus assembly protein [Symbiobacteriaceae bacterium]